MKSLRLLLYIFCIAFPFLTHAQTLLGEFTNVCPDAEYIYRVGMGSYCVSVNDISCSGCYDVTKADDNSSITLKWQSGSASRSVSTTVLCNEPDETGHNFPPSESFISRGISLAAGENPFFICADETSTSTIASDKPIPSSDSRCSDTKVRVTLSRDTDYPDFLNKGYPFDRSMTTDNTGVEVVRENTSSGVRAKLTLYWKDGWSGSIKVSIEYEKRNWDITDIFGKCETDPWKELVSYTYHRGGDPEGSLTGSETIILSGDEVTINTSYQTAYAGLVKGIRYSINGSQVEEKTTCNGDKTKLGLSYKTNQSGIFNIVTQVLDECGRWTEGPRKTVNVYPSCYQDNPVNVSRSISGDGLLSYPEGYQIIPENLYTISVSGITDFDKNYVINYGSGQNDMTISGKTFSISKKLGKYDISFTKKEGREMCPIIDPIVVFLGGKDQTLEKDCEFILPDNFDEFGFPDIDYGNIVLEHFAAIIKSKRAITVKPGVTLALGAEIILLQEPQLPPPTDLDLQRNFIQTTSYDEYNRVLAQTRNYFDDQGKNLQTQYKNISSGVMLASQTIYDAYSRSAAKTLAAPVDVIEAVQDVCDNKPVQKQDIRFQYRPKFITDIHGEYYDHADFDITPSTSKELTPDPVGNSEPGTLGWYYSANNGSATGENALMNEPLVASTQYPYIRTLFDADGSGDVTSVTNAGDQLRAGTGHYGVSYSESVSDEDQILNAYFTLRTNALKLAKPSSYTGNFQRDIAIDANGDKSIAYKDRSAKSIIKLFYGKSTEPITTSYDLYDDAARLVASVTPNGVSQFNGDNYDKIDKIAYTYNHKGWLVKSSDPDGGTTTNIHRRDGKVRFSQNSGQEGAGKYSYINYDRIGRPIETGEHISGPITYNSNEMKQILEVTLPGGGLSGETCTDRVFSFYDLPASVLENTGGPSDDALASTGRLQRFLQGAVSCTVKENIITTWFSYEERGRIEWVVQNITGLGIKTLDYRYGPSGKMQESVYQKGQPDRFTHYYEYDADGRLHKVYTTRGELQYTKTGELVNPEILQLQATYFYYLHGLLKRIEYANKIQGIDYVYTVNGLLKSINGGTVANDPGNDANDVFGITLNYFDGDYLNNTYSPEQVNYPVDVNNWFNGNIRSTTWHSPIENNRTFSYAYQYDNRNQLQNAIWGSFDGVNFDFNSPLKHYQESIGEYDLNGNIKSLERRSYTGLHIADFKYNYKLYTNQLSTITKINSPSDLLKKYGYNKIGQLIEQEDVLTGKKIKPEYDYSGRMKQIKDESDALLLTFDYDEKGFRIKKTTYLNASPWYTTWYIRDSEGNIVSTYEDDLKDSEVIQQTELPVYAKKRIGLFKPKFNLTFYELNDHLGNVRAVIGDKVKAEYLATMETERSLKEDDEFENIKRSVASLDINHTPETGIVNEGEPDEEVFNFTGPNEVVRINNKPMNESHPDPIGAGKMLLVHPKDKVTAEVFVKYGDFDNTQNEPLTGVAGFLASTFAISASPIDGFNIFREVDMSPTGVFSALGDVKSDLPRAFLTYIVYDKNFKPIAFDQVQVGEDAKIVGQSHHERLAFEITIEKEGYVYIYVSNQTDQNMDVYFDDLRINHLYSDIVAGSDFYPFGTIIDDRQITRQYYRYGYQGQSSEKDDETGWNHFEMREYDPNIARWLVPDPMRQHFSPYLALGNNPMNRIDLNGGFDWYYNEKEGLVHKEGVTGEQKGYTWVAGDNSTMHDVEQAMLWIDPNFDYIAETFRFYANPLATLNDNLNTGSDVTDMVAGFGQIQIDDFIGAQKVGIPYLKVLSYYRTLNSIGRVSSALGVATSFASLYYDHNAYSLPDNDPNKISGYRFGWRTVGNFGSIGVGATAGFYMGGPYGALLGGGFGASFWAAEQSYDGVVWYGQEVSKGAVNFERNGASWFYSRMH